VTGEGEGFEIRTASKAALGRVEPFEQRQERSCTTKSRRRFSRSREGDGQRPSIVGNVSLIPQEKP